MTKSTFNPVPELVIDWAALEKRFLEVWREARPFYIRWRLVNLLEEALNDDDPNVAELVERIMKITGGANDKSK